MKMNYIEAIRQAFDYVLEKDEKVMVFGLGVGDAGGVFGTTLGLKEKYGDNRVFDIPLSENAITGMALGLAIQGYRPIMNHQRVDFTLTSAEQIINQIAKTAYMSNGNYKVPIVIRMIIGRGWGQGPTHAQTLHSLYGQIPGLRVVAPSSPSDGYQLLLSAINSNEPTIFIEHRWLHQTIEDFSPEKVNSKIELSKLVRSGSDLTFVSTSYGVLECLKFAEVLSKFGIESNVINLKSIKPLDSNAILDAAKKTKRVVLWDIGNLEFGFTREISHLLYSNLFKQLDKSILSFGLPDSPTPSSPFLAANHYVDIDYALEEICKHFGFELEIQDVLRTREFLYPHKNILRDQPDIGEVGPF